MVAIDASKSMGYEGVGKWLVYMPLRRQPSPRKTKWTVCWTVGGTRNWVLCPGTQ